MTIEMCIPAFNEEQIIAESAKAVVNALREAGKSAIVTVSNNASTDATARVAASVPGVSVFSSIVRGKGAAVIAAAQRSTADVFGFIDADLSADPTEILTLLDLIERNDCDIAIGSRLIDTRVINRGFTRTVFSRLFNVVRKLVVGIDVKDTQCGLKLMNVRGKAVLAQCQETGWFFDMEFLARAERAGLRIREVPIRWREQRFPGRESKLRYLRDSFGALRAMVRIRRALDRSRL